MNVPSEVKLRLTLDFKPLRQHLESLLALVRQLEGTDDFSIEEDIKEGSDE